jgi:5-methylcytosine-specific restriction endonuclease McrA
MSQPAKCSVEKLEYQRRYREENKEKVRACKRKYRQENKEKIKEKDALYYKENREQIRKRTANYVATHRAEARARSAKWYAENPERGKANARVSGHRRRAKIAKVGGKFTKEDIRNLYVTQGACCFYCSTSIEEGYHIEHMTPISRGGTNGLDNVCLACAPCNRSKHTKTAEEFISG